MTEEERRRCILLGYCDNNQAGGTGGSGLLASEAADCTPGSCLAEMIQGEMDGGSDLVSACSTVLGRLGLPLKPTA